MIVELRTYSLKPGTVAAFLAHYQRDGLPLQARYLGEPIGFFTSDTGMLNRVIHLWGYRDAADREARRAALLGDEAWQAFLRESAAAGYLVSQESVLLTPVPFSRMR